MPQFSYAPTPTGYAVEHQQHGHLGTLERHERFRPGGARWVQWEPLTPTGSPGPLIDSRDHAAGWLLFELHPEPFARTPEPDPVMEAVLRYLRTDRDDLAAAVVTTAIATDIDEMRKRRRTSPAAVWHHLDRYTRWLDALNRQEPAKAKPDRLAHLRAL